MEDKEIAKFDPNQIAIADAEQIKEVNAAVLEATRSCTRTCDEMVQLDKSLDRFEKTHNIYRENCSIIRTKMQKIITKM